MDGLSRIDELQQKFSENPRRYFAPLANEYRKAGNTKRAIAICREHLAQTPGHMSGQIVYGQALFEGGEYEEAEKVFEGALKLDPENLIALRTLGDLALRTGDSSEARTRYLRLLEADPKDSTVIALVSEIDASLKASSPSTTEQIPAIDGDGGDQAIVLDNTAIDPDPAAAEVDPEPESAPLEAPVPVVAGPVTLESEPIGLERHYPSEAILHEVETAASSTFAAPEPVAEAATEALDASVEESGEVPQSPATEWQGTAAPPDLDEDFDERDRTSESSAPEQADENVAEPAVEMSAVAPDDPFDTWAPPSGAPLNEVAAPSPEDSATVAAAGADQIPELRPAAVNPEPFVNETMAQLYLQQGHPALALSVYRQLAANRPDEPRFADKVKELEAQSKAPEARREEPPSIESPTPEREGPRAPSIEAPMAPPTTQPGSEEVPGFDGTPIDSPPTSTPPSERDSVESPGRDEPRAEPEGIAARQPSVKEFFATLGRRRPPASGNGSGGQPRQSGMQSGSGTLDSVFAGATVSAEDDRAASALAGAFTRGGDEGESRGDAAASSPPPAAVVPMAPLPSPVAAANLAPPRRASMTPRANAAPESEEDVAKFRAWLDGLTGE